MVKIKILSVPKAMQRDANEAGCSICKKNHPPVNIIIQLVEPGRHSVYAHQSCLDRYIDTQVYSSISYTIKDTP